MSRSKTDREEYQDFKKILSELSANFQKLNLADDTEKRVTKNSAKKRHAVQLYKEILIILERIDNELQTMLELDMESFMPREEGVLDSQSPLFKIITEILHQRDLLLVDFKSLLHWIYVLDDSLGLVFPKNIRDFRNIFITHFATRISDYKKSRNLQHSTHYSQAGTQIVFFSIKNKNFQGFKQFITAVKAYIPEVENETNYNEQIRIIWENIDKLPKKIIIRGKTINPIDFLSQYGGRSPSILNVTEALLDVLKKRVSKIKK